MSAPLSPIELLEALTRPALRAPAAIRLSDWAEAEVRLPEGSSARPGSYRNWPYMREILDSFADPGVERVTVLKSARIGYTKGAMIAIGALAATDPAPIILLMPTDDDARGIAVDEIEPLFAATPALDGILKKGRNDGRNTILRKSIRGGGSIKILSSRSPRKLRRHDCRYLIIDEADAMLPTVEGDPIAIAEARTLAAYGRKIIVGSTPTEEGISVIDRMYGESDQSIFEVPCPECSAFNEIQWERDILWEPERPETARYRCPHCSAMVAERFKPWMIDNGRWRAQRPEVQGHRGFRINALVSLLANATWPKLAAEWLKAKRGGPAILQPFVNTVLGRSWRTSVALVDADVLKERAEPWGLYDSGKAAIPREVVAITAGVDVQDDRLEITLLGWTADFTAAPLALGHMVLEGNTLDAEVWHELDQFSRRRWAHPNGWKLGIDGMAVDSGGREGRTQVVYNWCQPRSARRIYAIKGVPGAKPVWKRASRVKGSMKLVNIAVDIVKTNVLDMLAREPFPEALGGARDPLCMRFAEALPEDWFEQVCNETRRLRYRQGRPIYVFEVKRTGMPTEALDATVYAWAVRQSPGVRAIDLHERAARLPPEPEPVTDSEVVAKLPPSRAAKWAAKFAELSQGAK